MKRIFTYLTSALIILSACSKEEGQLSENKFPDTEFCAAISSEKTKVLYEDTELKLKAAWEKDDRIGIFSVKAEEVLSGNSQYHDTSDGVPTSFAYVSRSERVRWASETEAQSFYAYYPYHTLIENDPHKVGITLEAEQFQQTPGDVSHLSGNDFLWASKENIIKSETPVDLDFNYAFSVVEVDLTASKRMLVEALVLKSVSNSSAALAFKDARIDLGNGKIDYSQASEKSSRIRLNCNFATSMAGATKFFMLVNPDLAGETLELSAVVGGVEHLLATRTVPSSGLNTRNVMQIKVDFDVPADAELSTKDLGSLGTANTYIVNAANEYYRFRADIKGNGVIPDGLAPIVASSSISPKSVLVLWYNTVQTDNRNWVESSPVILNSVVLSDSYIYFDTPKEFVNGNVVIAAFAEEGVTYDNITVDSNGLIDNATLLWSWNIWAVKDYDPESSCLTAGDYKILDRNLGAAVEGSSAKGNFEPTAAVGNYYQWGRKDPFPQFSDYRTYAPCDYFDALIATPTYTPITAMQNNGLGENKNVDSQIFKKGSVLVSKTLINSGAGNPEKYIEFTERHPYKFVDAKNENNNISSWIDRTGNYWKNLWGDTGSGERTITKTLYDPCPPGWRVWQKEAVEAFEALISSSSLTFKDFGFMYGGHYFPFCGSGRNGLGDYKVNQVKVSGLQTCTYYWSSTTFNEYSGFMYPFQILAPANYNNTTTSVTFNNTTLKNNSTGCNLRCVKE